MSYPSLGDFEEMVLLAAAGLGSDAYAVSIQQRIEQQGRRAATMGAVYTALDRLEQKGFLESWLGESTAQRGGRRKRFYRITNAGIAAVTTARQARDLVPTNACGLTLWQILALIILAFGVSKSSDAARHGGRLRRPHRLRR